MQSHQNKNQNKHDPVLLEQVLQYLNPNAQESYLDVTAGYGGHAAAILERTSAPQKAVLVDRDQQAINWLQTKFAGLGTQIVHSDFLSASQAMNASGRQFDLILADLGVSSPHLNMASRGFSHAQSGPLDMRMDERQTLTAEHLVNTMTEAELAALFRKYGEEPRAKRIARLIVSRRPIRNTSELATIAAIAW